jgi:hypothetical protein
VLREDDAFKAWFNSLPSLDGENSAVLAATATS